MHCSHTASAPRCPKEWQPSSQQQRNFEGLRKHKYPRGEGLHATKMEKARWVRVGYILMILQNSGSRAIISSLFSFRGSLVMAASALAASFWRI